MTVPNVYMKWSQRIATCRWCKEPVKAGTPVVCVYFWNKGTEGRRWNNHYFYHPQCWITQGLDYLKMNPYTPYIRHKKSPLTDEQRKQRYLILRRKAALDQRKRNLKAEYPDRTLIEARIDIQITELMLEIVPIGGIPPKWLD